MSVIWEILEQHRGILDSFQLLCRGDRSSVRREHPEREAKRKEELCRSTRRAVGHTQSGRVHQHLRRDVSRADAGYQLKHDHAGYDPLDAGDFPDDPTSQLSPTDPNGVRGLLIPDSLALVEKRIRDVKEVTDRASHLEIWVSKKPSFLSLLP